MDKAYQPPMARIVPPFPLFALRCAREDVRRLLVKLTQTPPMEVGTFVSQGGFRIYCLGPDEWLISAPDADHQKPQLCFDEKDTGDDYSLVDVSDSRVCFEIRGDGVEDLLAYGCALDLAPSMFSVGRSVRTQFRGVTVVIARLEMTCFLMMTMRSYGEHVHELLSLASGEVEATRVNSNDLVMGEGGEK